MSLVIVACTAAKFAGESAAATKYNSRQHRSLFTEFFNEGAFCSHDVMILSAEFGLVDVTKSIPDYDRLLDVDRAAEFAGSDEQARILEAAVAGHDVVHVYGGTLYRALVRDLLVKVGFKGQVDELVGRNRGCGDHFSALSDLFYDWSVDA